MYCLVALQLAVSVVHTFSHVACAQQLTWFARCLQLAFSSVHAYWHVMVAQQLTWSVHCLQLFAWGWGRYGNLGDGEKTDRYATATTS